MEFIDISQISGHLWIREHFFDSQTFFNSWIFLNYGHFLNLQSFLSSSETFYWIRIFWNFEYLIKFFKNPLRFKRKCCRNKEMNGHACGHSWLPWCARPDLWSKRHQQALELRTEVWATRFQVFAHGIPATNKSQPNILCFSNSKSLVKEYSLQRSFYFSGCNKWRAACAPLGTTWEFLFFS